MVVGTVRTPFGPVKKQTAVIAAGGLLLLAGIAWWRHRKAGTAAGPSPAPVPGTSPIGGGDPFPPDGTTGDPGDPNSTDPATGMTYGDEQAGYTGGNYYGSYPGLFTGPSGPGGFATNAAWAQAAEQYMGSDGHDAIAAALGRYLHGDDVSEAQKTTIEEAIAAEGQPPVAGPGGYPPSIHLHATHTPPVKKAKNPVSGLRATNVTATAITVSWHKDTHAASYLVTVLEYARSGGGLRKTQPASGGRHQVQQHTTTTARAHITGLRPRTRYDIRVRAQPGTGTRDANVTVTTR